ncbi:hypothetical protein M3Y97_00604300 [Aphelenchoides bicaudatus]|nr:hypothetical protein M3Y97_00604300 [Aphelenchoides bicaudatus]
MGCKNATCAQVTVGNVLILVFRTRFVDSHSDHVQFHKFLHFVNEKRPVFRKALDEQLKLYDEPSNVVNELASQYSFNLSRFYNHQGYALLRASKPNFINTCKTNYGALTFNILGNNFMQTIGHHSSTVDSDGNTRLNNIQFSI